MTGIGLAALRFDRKKAAWIAGLSPVMAVNMITSYPAKAGYPVRRGLAIPL
jgi:hypothetical protein